MAAGCFEYWFLVMMVYVGLSRRRFKLVPLWWGGVVTLGRCVNETGG